MKKNIQKIIFSLSLVFLICENAVAASKISVETTFWNLEPADYYTGFEFGILRTDPSHTDSIEGLQFNGSGYRTGTKVYSIIEVDFSAGGEIYITWKPNGGKGLFWGSRCSNCYMRVNFGIGWFDGKNLKNIVGAADGTSFTVNHSFAGSVHILPDIWYYSHITITDDQNYTAVTSVKNYDDRGGEAFLTTTGFIQDEYWEHITNTHFYGESIDSYGAKNAQVVMKEVNYFSSKAGNKAVVIAENLDFHIPVIEYQTNQQSSLFSANFKFSGSNSNNDLIWKLKNYEKIDGKLEKAAPADVYEFSNNFMRIYASQFGEKNFWADFEFMGNKDGQDALTWKLLDFGVNSFPDDNKSWNLLLENARIGDIMLFNHNTACIDSICPLAGATPIVFGNPLYGFYSHAALISNFDKANKKIEIFHATGSQFASSEQLRKDWFDLNKLRQIFEGGRIGVYRVKSVSDSDAEQVIENAVAKYDDFIYLDAKEFILDSNSIYNSALVREAYKDAGFILDDKDVTTNASNFSAFLFTPDELASSESLENILEWEPLDNQ